jgi:sortase (surface protein transpeptidase)
MGPVANIIVPNDVVPEVASAVMDASAPVRVAVPSIGVDTALMDLGLMPDGTLEVPPDGTLAGWYTGSPTPGERGPSIIAGHVDWSGPAVFHHLSLVVPGDLIEVIRADGTEAAFEVTEVGQYPKAEFPTADVYGAVEVSALRLITCGGVVNSATGHYDDNIVVYAVLVTPELERLS